MKYRDQKKWGVVVGAGLLASATLLSQAKAELVYDDEASQATQQRPTEARIEDRESLRQVIKTSQKAQVTTRATTQVAPQPQLIQQPQYVVQAQQPVVTQVNQPLYAQQAPVVVQQSEVATSPVVIEGSRPEVQNLSRSELMRRERLREEMKNEDAIQERLEQLRLRDEQHRTDQVLVNPDKTPAAIPVGNAVMKEEVVSIPVTEKPIQLQQTPEFAVPPAPVNGQVILTSQAAPVTNQGMGTSMATTANSSSDEEKTQFTITPKGGVSSMGDNSVYSVKPRFTAGIGLGMGVSDQLTVETGYAYSEYGVGYINGGGYSYPGMSTFEDKVLKQNLFEMGLKFHLLGRDSKFRPFVGGGGAYSKSFLNYDPKFVQYNPGMSPDYESSAYLGYLAVGFDVKVSKSVTIGAAFKRYSVLSSRQNSSLNGAGFGNYGAYGNYSGYNSYGVTSADPGKEQAGNSLADSSFHSITVGVSFIF
ncbi:MAG: hypothetical protein H7222_00045 [Methylotenera sp.]|nr:hypothetical protein [Oligoflexia bacterium]